MKKIALLLSAVMLISLLPTISFAAGNTISTAAELQNFRDSVNNGNTYEGQTVTLEAQVDLSSISWNSIGTEEHPFKGTFDGGGKTVTGLNAETEDMYAGLFGYNSGTIKNLNVETTENGVRQSLSIETGVEKKSKHMFGGAVAAYNTGNILNCTAKGLVYGYNQYSYMASGGICGMNKGTISDCENSARVYVNQYVDYTKLYGDAYAGGICAINEGFVANSSSNAQGKTFADHPYIEEAAGIYASSRFASAIAGGGIGDNRGNVSKVTSSGTVHANINFAVGEMSYAYAGGICGSNTGTVSGSTSECYITSQQHSDTDDKRRNFLMSGGISGYNKGELSGNTFNGLVTSGTDINSSVVAYTGGVCGYNYGTISDCEFGANAKITDGRLTKVNRWTNNYSPDYAGGICGYNDKGTITQCRAKGKLYPREYFANNNNKYYGGIVGENNGTVSVSYSMSDIILDGDSSILIGYGLTINKKAEDAATDSKVYAGGLSGNNNGIIENCYHYTTSQNSLKAYNVGGLSGVNSGLLENCYSNCTADITLIGNGKGICPMNNGMVNSCYFRIDSLDDDISEAKKTVAQMRSKATFVNWPFDVCWILKAAVNRGNPSFITGEYKFSGGMGTEQSPYIVKTAVDLYSMRFYKDASYIIANDIEYPYEWSPMGSISDPFTGKIDGNYCTIKVPSINGSFGNCGLIGYGNGCDIKNITVKSDKQITVHDNKSTGIAYAGMIIAQGTDVTVENCKFDGGITISAPFAYAGAIAGDVNGTVKGCRSLGTLTASGSDFKNMTLGGILGRINGSVLASESSVTINAGGLDDKAYANVGGVAGLVQGEMTNCCYNGTISNNAESPSSFTGGTAGLVDGDINTTYADATLSSPSAESGGIAAKLYNGIEFESYFNHTTSADSGIGTPTDSSEFTADGLLGTFKAYNDSDYIWTADKKSGKMTLLHVNPVWTIADGFTKCSFESNSDTCEIYYTTDGSNPIGSGTKYTEPFFGNVSDLKYYAKDNGSSTGIFSYSPSPKHLYPMQFTQAPTNGSGAVITKENIASSDTVNVPFLSDVAVTSKVYLALYDENDIIKYASCADKTIIKGENTIQFTNIKTDGVSGLRIFVWDTALVPYTPELKF